MPKHDAKAELKTLNDEFFTPTKDCLVAKKKPKR